MAFDQLCEGLVVTPRGPEQKQGILVRTGVFRAVRGR
jgi:hypothetical protein